MKLRLTFDLDERARLAISRIYGDDTPANYERVANWIDMTIDLTLQDLVYEMDEQDGQTPRDEAAAARNVP
jgi:hypothetical protein